MSVQKNISYLTQNIPSNVHLVAVSKTKPIAMLQEAYEAGQRAFGENKVQEMVSKWESLPKDIQWHFIGHLQKNKMKYMAAFVSLIHGVDSLSTLREIEKQAKKHQRVISCLLQAKISEEATKFGLPMIEIQKILFSEELKKMEHVKIVGLMGMASFTDDTEQVAKEFRSLKDFFDQTDLAVLSMGMSGDYHIAIQEGATMVRLGSTIFGARN
jgi:pyridoxal phosphate enzyme (YggS family)